MLKKLAACLLAAALLPLTAVPDGGLPILKAHAEEDIEYGVWYTETENGASYCWMLEEPKQSWAPSSANRRLHVKANGSDCIVPEYGEQSELPWFSNLDSIFSLVIEESFVNYPEMLFQNYPKLTDVTILGNHYYDENPENDTPLNAFEGCDGLMMVLGDVPQEFDTSSYSKGFQSYSDEIHFAEKDPQYLAAYYGCAFVNTERILFDGFWGWDWNYCRCILVDNGDFWFYAEPGLGQEVSCDLSEQAENIWDKYRADVKYVHFLSDINRIGTDYFKDCVNLEKIDWPSDGPSYLYGGAFENCISLKEIVLPYSLRSMYAANAFLNCTSLEKIVLPQDPGDRWDEMYPMLQGCKSLKEIRFPKSMTTIYGPAFTDCTALEELYFPDSLKNIHGSLPENMKLVVVPPSVSTILSELETNVIVTSSDTILYGLSGSYVEEYCTANDIKFSDVSALFNITEEDGVISGDFHKQPKLSWTLDAEGTLTISGRGNMEWLQTELLVPWYGYREQIKKIVVEDGIYQILDGYYFKDCPNATSLHLPDSVYKIDVYKNDASADISSNYTIHAHKDSYAALFAARKGLDLIEVPRYSYRYQSNINNWSFLNTADYFRSSDTHFILDSYRERLMAGADDTTVLSSVSNTEKKRMEKMLESSWNGSCWGMAVTSILSCYDQFDFSDYDASATHLHDLQNTEEVESLLNYYWALQFTNEMRTQIESYKKQKDVVKVEDLLTNIADEKPTLLAYSFPAGSHAVVAYGYTVSEEGGYVFEIDGQSYTYDIRINLYDNITDNSEHLNPDACMYVNTGQNGYYQWYIPEYNAVHNSKLEKNNTAALSFVCSDVETLNYHGYLSGNDKTSGLAFVSSLETDSIDGVKIMENKNILSMEPVSVYDGEYPADDCFRFPLEGTENPCTAELKGEGEQSLTMNYAECMLSVCAEQADLVKFQPGGTYMTVIGNGAVCEMELVFNDESCITDWYALTVRCDTPSKQYSIKKATASENGKNGYILNSDSAIGRFVAEAENDSDVAGTICSTELKSVLLYEIDPATIGILGDADGDGVFETTLSAAGMQLLDVIRLQKYILCQTDLTRTECSRYDLRQDDVINGYDLALLKRAVLAG